MLDSGDWIVNESKRAIPERIDGEAIQLLPNGRLFGRAERTVIVISAVIDIGRLTHDPHHVCHIVSLGNSVGGSVRVRARACRGGGGGGRCILNLAGGRGGRGEECNGRNIAARRKGYPADAAAALMVVCRTSVGEFGRGQARVRR